MLQEKHKHGSQGLPGITKLAQLLAHAVVAAWMLALGCG